MVVVVNGLATDFTTDPNTALLNYLKNNWAGGGAAGDPDLVVSNISFSTDWDDKTKNYQVVVKPARTQGTPFVGGFTWDYASTHRIILFAKGTSSSVTAKEKKFRMEQELQRLILVFPTGQSAGGFRVQVLQGFVDGIPNEPVIYQAQSTATVTLQYDKTVS